MSNYSEKREQTEAELRKQFDDGLDQKIEQQLERERDEGGRTLHRGMGGAAFR